jgi:electron transport complex protein RnfC
VQLLEGPSPFASDAPLILLETDGLDLKAPSLPPLEGTERSPEHVLERLHACGVLGMGGAGFPTAQKIRSLLGPLKLLIINGAECEPFLTCDERSLREKAREVLTAAEALARIFGIPEVIIAVESSRFGALSSLQEALFDGNFSLSALFHLPDRYPAGGERQIIQTVRGLAMPGGTHPVDHGILCLNVQTILAVGAAIDSGECLTRRVITVSGNGVRQPANLDVLIGTPIDYLLECCGGVKEGRQQLILGGAMMGFSVASTEIPITKTTSALLVLSDTDLASIPHLIEHPCIRCGACTDACPQGLLPHSLHDLVKAKRMAELEHLHLLDCIECGCCDVVCPSIIPLTERFRQGKKQLRRYLTDEQLARKAQNRHQARQVRLQREQLEREQEAEARKNALGQGAKPQIQEALERARLKREQRLNAAQGPSKPDAL